MRPSGGHANMGGTDDPAPTGTGRPGPAGQPSGGAPDAERTETLIARYRAILESDPRETFAFQRLMDLYRERDGSVDRFQADLLAEVAADEREYPARMLLGHLYKAQQRRAEALRMYREAAVLRPNDPAPHGAEGRLAAAGGDVPAARTALARALTLTREDQARRELHEELAQLALSASDFDEAAAHYGELARGADAGIYQRTAYARALLSAGHHERAIAEYERVVAALRGDNRVLAPVLRELGQAQLAAGQVDEAIATFQRALRVAGRESGVRAEIYDGMVDAYRRSDRLADLISELEGSGQGGFEALELIARLHDELGHEEEALAAYRRALGSNPRHIDTRVRLAQLLARSGRLTEVIAEYRQLIRSAPREPRFVVELAQLLMQTGQRDEALQLAARSSRQFGSDPAVHEALAELYTRWGEVELAQREVEQLVRIDPSDPAHLIALGEQQLDQGDEAGAVRTWQRILSAEPDRARAYATLAGVYADHAMDSRAEEAYREALRLAPTDVDNARGLATVLERPLEGESSQQRAARDMEAIEVWQRVIGLDGVERAARREARRRVVAIYARRRLLPAQLTAWGAAFEANPPDLEAGRYLSEAHLQRRPRDLPAARATLARLIELAPGDVESLIALERVHVVEGDRAAAISVLRRLVEADARRAPRYLQQMAEHAHALYRDEDAVAYAAEAVQRSPDDAEGHRRLGDLYRSRQDTAHAIESYRRAIELNERLFTTYFQLAELHLAEGDSRAADALLRRVVRSSPDDELVSQAARVSMQINLGEGTLEVLEQELLPMALAHVQRPVFRKLVVDLYDQMTSPWIQLASSSGPSRERAEADLHRLGARAIKPLLEALADDDPRQQRIAVEILGHLGNPNAAGPLLALAENAERDGDLRMRALTGAGAVAPESLAPRFAALATGPESRLRATAAWSLARMGGRRAAPVLRSLLGEGDRSVRAFAALGLGRIRELGAAAALRTLLVDDPDPSVRACAAWALGRLGQTDDVPALVTSLRNAGEALLARASAHALGQVGSPDARDALAYALFDTAEGQHQAAAQALRAPHDPAALSALGPFPVPQGVAAASEYLPLLLDIAAAGEAVELEPLRDALVGAAQDALHGPVESVRGALALLAASPQVAAADARPTIGLGMLTRDLGRWESGTRARASTALEALGAALVEDIAAVSRHPDRTVREGALAVLARLTGDLAEQALVAALGDDEPTVVGAALRVLRDRPPTAQTVAQVTQLANEHAHWPTRLEAAHTLASYASGAAPGPALTAAQRAQVVSQLAELLTNDRYAFVREAAAQGLGGADSPSAHAALERARDHDADERVRRAATVALQR
ncbi:MAG: HEAT repeat domain-containing protein [Polyangiales bacterium]